MKKTWLILWVFVFPGCADPGKTPAGTDQPPVWSMTGFVKADAANPILLPDSTTWFNCPFAGKLPWEAKDVFNPAALVRNDTIFLLYRAEDRVGKFAGTSRIGLAWSMDGLHFTKHPKPVLYPDRDAWSRYEWEGGCEDPRVVKAPDGSYLMTYTAYDGTTARLMIASSADLFHWTKHGPAFSATQAIEGKPAVDLWSKSGSIVCRYEQGQAVAKMINGRYWMYWGDTDIFLASSEDLVHWQVQTTPEGRRKAVFGKRPGKFDSDLVEPGPPAIWQADGILLLYNSRNDRAHGDTSLPDHSYAAGQILLSAQDPAVVKARMDHHFIRPDRDFEIRGQVNQVCFIEGLVQMHNTWYLYYGTADSKIAVALREAPATNP